MTNLHLIEQLRRFDCREPNQRFEVLVDRICAIVEAENLSVADILDTID